MKTIKRKNGTVYREKIYVEGKQIAKIFKRKSDAIAWKVKMLSMRNAEELNLKHFEDVPGLGTDYSRVSLRPCHVAVDKSQIAGTSGSLQ